jgi:hypothetical protein
MAIAGLCVAASMSANATVTIGYPMELSTPGIVGEANGFSGDNAAKTEPAIAQNLLNAVGLGQTWFDTSDQNRLYKTSTLQDYAGTITGSAIPNNLGPTSTIGGVDYTYVAAGYDYVIAKYGGGGNGGFVLFALGDQAAYIPVYSHDFWGSDAGQYQISGYTLFNTTSPSPVPEPTTVLAGALLLLPFGASTVRMFRKKA